MKEIILTQGRVALVDDCDYEKLNCFKWYAHKGKKTFYAKRKSPRIDGKRYIIYMHHEIIGRPPEGYEPDHRDRNGLNNQRGNLRHVTHRQNQQNRKNQESSSRYPGVCWHKPAQKWVTRIVINGKREFLGYFSDEKKAFFAYKNAVEVLGETVIDENIYINL